MKPSRIKPIAIAVIAIAAAVGIGIALMAARKEAQPAPQAAGPKPALTVAVARPRQQQLPIRLAANGDIAAWQEASIGSEANGLRLSEVLVNVGDTVRAGQVLATFASETVQADVAQARAALAEAEATAADAAANAARARALAASGAMSEQEIKQYQTAEQTARARVAAARAALDAQQLRMKHVQVLAPDSGVISERKATVGAVAGAGTELFRMIRKGRLEWRAQVTAAEIGRLKVDTPALVSAVNGAQIRGKVRAVAPTVDLQSRTGLVYVDLLPGPDGAMPAKAGMFARGEFDLGTSVALTVPQQAVVLHDGFSYVFRLTPDHRVVQVKIQTGRRIGELVEVRDGLQADALVVASGAGFLNDGDLVRVNADAAGADDPPPVSGKR